MKTLYSFVAALCLLTAGGLSFGGPAKVTKPCSGEACDCQACDGQACDGQACQVAQACDKTGCCPTQQQPSPATRPAAVLALPAAQPTPLPPRSVVVKPTTPVRTPPRLPRATSRPAPCCQQRSARPTRLPQATVRPAVRGGHYRPAPCPPRRVYYSRPARRGLFRRFR